MFLHKCKPLPTFALIENSTLKILGKNDRVNFPSMGLTDVPVKIDTGAYTSSIHYPTVMKKNNCLICTIKIGTEVIEEVFEEFKTRTVKSSNGQSEERYAVKSTIEVYGKRYKIELTLSKRGEMRFPVLIGRKFLRNKFIVDVSKKSLSYNSKN